MKDYAGLLTYLDLRKVFDMRSRCLPFRQLEDNKNQADRYPTSWSVQRGHHFYLWKKYIKNDQNKKKNSSPSCNIIDSNGNDSSNLSHINTKGYQYNF